MNASARTPITAFRRLALASIAVATLGTIVIGTAALPAHAATTTDKSRYAKVDGGATRLVARVARGLNARTDKYSTYATMNTGTIAAILKRVNALPKAPPSGEMCPMDVAATLTLSFYRNASTPYAVVVADPGGCGNVSIRDYNANDTLQGSAALGGGVALSNYVATQMHIKSLQVL
jgi:hypothetical protein